MPRTLILPNRWVCAEITWRNISHNYKRLALRKKCFLEKISPAIQCDKHHQQQHYWDAFCSALETLLLPYSSIQWITDNTYYGWMFRSIVLDVYCNLHKHYHTILARLGLDGAISCEELLWDALCPNRCVPFRVGFLPCVTCEIRLVFSPLPSNPLCCCVLISMGWSSTPFLVYSPSQLCSFLV